MSPFVVPIVAMLFVGCPAVVFGFILGIKALKVRNNQIELKRQELEMETRKLEIVRLQMEEERYARLTQN